LATKVRAVVERGNPAERAAVAAELTRLARELLDPAWLATARPKVERANGAAGLMPTPAQLSAQIEAWRTELLAHVFDAMRVVHAPEDVALIFKIAADSTEPLDRRKLALLVLDAIVLPQDAMAIQQREALRNEMSAAQQAADADPSTDLRRRVAEMRAPFRLCYQEQLAREPGAGYHGTVKFTIEPNGQTSTIATTDLPEGMIPCVEAVVQATRFASAAESRVVQFPLTLVADSGTSAASNPCLSYEPSVVELAGTLERKDYPGPPNYESIEHGDARETTWLLRLDRAACTLDGASPSDPARLGITLLQLVFMDADHEYPQYRSLMGKRIVARGTLFGAQTGHHHTDVLLTVSEIKASK
jgi:hypothetical protein